MTEFENLLLKALPVLVEIMLAAALAVLLVRYFALARKRVPLNTPLRALFPRFAKKNVRVSPIERVILITVSAFLLSRAIIYLLGLISGVYAALASTPAIDVQSYFDIARAAARDYIGNWRGLLVQWDAYHYLGLADNGYVTQGDARFHIVFYPLYPYLVRALKLITGETLTSAVLISNSCMLINGVLLYKLTELTYGFKTATRAVWLFMFNPAGAFFSVAYTESLFMALALAAVYLARKRHFAWAVVCGALCAFTRSPGIIVAIPIYYEMLRADARNMTSAKETYKRMALGALKCVPVLTGLAAYILVNKLVTGDALRFLTYQSEHWGQRMGSVANTVRYTLSGALTSTSDNEYYGIWLPQIIMIPLIAALIALSARSTHPRDGAYSVIYYAFTICPTWLLSGTRYLCAMYSLYPALARACEKKHIRYAVYAIEGALFVYSSIMYTHKHWLL